MKLTGYIFIVSLILSFLNVNEAKAQIEKMSYSDEVKAVMNNNIHQGLDMFSGLKSKLSIKYDDTKLIPSQRLAIINKIKAISGVTDCEIKEDTFEIIVYSTAIKDCPNYILYKQIISNHQLVVISNHELIFQ